MVHNDLLFSAAIGICKYHGGGFQLLPSAIADDGMFDITLIKPFHWWHLLFRFNRLFNGTVYSIGHCVHYRGSNIRIESTPNIPVAVDGELLGGTPLEFTMHYHRVKVIVNKDFLK